MNMGGPKIGDYEMQGESVTIKAHPKINAISPSIHFNLCSVKRV
jgi:hypothetical protein